MHVAKHRQCIDFFGNVVLINSAQRNQAIKRASKGHTAALQSQCRT